MLIAVTSALVAAGWVSGGVFSGALIAWTLHPTLRDPAPLAKQSKNLRYLLSFVVFGSGVIGGGVFRLYHGADAPTIWACYLIGLAPSFIGIMFYLDWRARAFVSRAQRLPADELSAIRDALEGNDPNDASIEQALDSLEIGEKSRAVEQKSS